MLGLPPDKVVLVAPQSIPKTSSGKIRRAATRTLYLEGRLSGSRRPPWMQFARLELENLGNWLELARRNVVAWLHRSSRASLFGLVAYAGGCAARLAPGRSAPHALARAAARSILWLSGHSVRQMGTERLNGGKPIVFIANRPGHLDPLVVMARIPVPFRFADAAVLAELPSPAAFLLRPFVVPLVREASSPPGGTLRQRIAKCLGSQGSVLVLPDGPAGVQARRSRFRLDGLHAADETSCAIQPVFLHNTEGVAWPDRKSEARTRNSEIGIESPEAGKPGEDPTPQIVWGEVIHPEVNSPRDMILLRDRVRESLAKLAR